MLASLLPAQPVRGGQWLDHWQVINAIGRVKRTESPWRQVAQVGAATTSDHEDVRLGFSACPIPVLSDSARAGVVRPVAVPHQRVERQRFIGRLMNEQGGTGGKRDGTVTEPAEVVGRSDPLGASAARSSCAPSGKIIRFEPMGKSDICGAEGIMAQGCDLDLPLVGERKPADRQRGPVPGGAPGDGGWSYWTGVKRVRLSAPERLAWFGAPWA